jgi:hypothetical protein
MIVTARSTISPCTVGNWVKKIPVDDPVRCTHSQKTVYNISKRINSMIILVNCRSPWDRVVWGNYRLSSLLLTSLRSRPSQRP